MPSASTSHMKLKRCCPGVPNSDSSTTMSSSASVSLPKSIETVVFDLIELVWSVTTVSVPMTGISDIVLTSVVLPAANGPVMTNLMTTVSRSCSSSSAGGRRAT